MYALGVVIYQLLTGRLPWEGTTLAELAIRRESERPLPPSSYDPAVPRTLSTAVLRSLEGDPALRYSTARQLAVALRAGLGGQRAAAARGRGADAGAAPASTTEATRRLAPSEPVAPVARPAPAPPRPARRAPPGGPARRGQAAPLGSPAASAARIGILLVIALLAAVIAAVVLLTTNAGQNTDLVKQTIPDQIQSLKDFINSHSAVRPVTGQLGVSAAARQGGAPSEDRLPVVAEALGLDRLAGRPGPGAPGR